MTVGSLGAEVRRTRIRELLQADGALDLSWAADELGVSEMTVRRDLAELERQGLVRRVRGGAIAVEPERFDRRAARNNTAKARIATKLQALVPTRGFIAMDSSSTIHRLASDLGVTGDVTAFTTGLETFHALRGKGVHTMLSGGELEDATGAFVGPVAARAVEDFRFARAFLGASGLDPDRGALESTLANAEVKRALRRATTSVVVAVDASKLEATSAAVALRLPEIDILVTDLDPTDPRLDPYRDHVELR